MENFNGTYTEFGDSAYEIRGTYLTIARLDARGQMRPRIDRAFETREDAIKFAQKDAAKRK